MNVEQARGALRDQTFLLGWWRRRQARQALLASPEPQALLALAEAAAEGVPEADRILAALLVLRPEAGAGRFEALWRYWRERRFEPLLQAVGDSKPLRAALAGAAECLPADDGGNATVFDLWYRLDCPELARVIASQCRQAPSLELDALFGLVQGDAQRYLALQDPEGDTFQGAFLLATPAMRQRLNQTVTTAQVERLTLAYRRAMFAQGQVDVAQLMRVGDADGVFEATRTLRLDELLGVLDHWARDGRRPADPARRQAVDKALQGFARVGALKVEEGPAPPDGLVDLLAHEAGLERSEADLRRDLASEDPLARAAALYVGASRGLVGRDALEKAGRQGTWAEKLVARAHAPELIPTDGPAEHVWWLKECAGVDAALLGAKVHCTPPEYEANVRNLEQLGADPHPLARRRAGLLQALTPIQAVFVGGKIEVGETDDATETGAIEMEVVDDKDLW